MRFSHAFAFVLAAAGLAAMAGETAAQTLPPPYAYPPGGYRGVPDKDGVMTVDPDDDDRVERVDSPAASALPVLQSLRPARRFGGAAGRPAL